MPDFFSHPTNRKVLLLIVATTVIGGLFLIRKNSVPAPIALNDIRTWQAHIRADGAQAAADFFWQTLATKSGTVQHDMGHIFGRALIAEIGAESLAVCTNRTNAGCIHEIIGRALIDNGTEGIAALATRCTRLDEKNERVCIHGIGHGVLALYGYTEKNVASALTLCDRLGTDEAKRCQGGVFMEYNFRNMSEEQRRRAEDTDPYTPCFSLKETYKTRCVAGLPTWWADTLRKESKRTDTEVIAEIAQRCQKLTNPTKKMCLAGAGYAAAMMAQFDPPITHTYCSTLASTPAEFLICTEAAAIVTSAQDSEKNALQICSILQEDKKHECEEYATQQHTFLDLLAE